MRRLLSSVLVLAALLGCLALPAAAADTDEVRSASALYSLGLFNGTGSNSDGTPILSLDLSATRAQAVTMLVRLLGKEDEAEEGGWTTPFADLPSWAEDSIGYAYTMGYTKGVSSTAFDPDSTITAQQYLTLVLRALGYSESDGDFTYETAETFARSLGLYGGGDGSGFTRGDMAEISYAALAQNINGTSTTLRQSLVNAGVLDGEAETAALSSSDGTMTAEEIYSACSPAVFYLTVYDSSGNALQSGSGFFIDSDGTAVTNYHVIEGGSSATVTLSSNGEVYSVVGVYDYDEGRDIALLNVSGSGFPYLDLGDSDNLAGGATVYAIGSPLGLSSTISQGIISNADREYDGYTYIQTTAPISSGSSGGALINDLGQVVGITCGTFADGQNLNLAVPISSIEELDCSSCQALAALASDDSLADVSMSLSASSVTLSQGQTASVTITYSSRDILSLGDNVYLGGSISARGVVSAQINWMSNATDTATLSITGIGTGTAAITVQMKDSSGNLLASQLITATVK